MKARHGSAGNRLIDPELQSRRDGMEFGTSPEGN